MLEADSNLTNHTDSDLPIKIANYLPLSPIGIHSIGHLSQNQPVFLSPPPPLQHAVTPEDLFMLLIKLITNDVLPPVQTADTYPTSQSCSSWLSCLRRAKLAGLWPVCKKKTWYLLSDVIPLEETWWNDEHFDVKKVVLNVSGIF